MRRRTPTANTQDLAASLHGARRERAFARRIQSELGQLPGRREVHRRADTDRPPRWAGLEGARRHERLFAAEGEAPILIVDAAQTADRGGSAVRFERSLDERKGSPIRLVDRAGGRLCAKHTSVPGERQ